MASIFEFIHETNSKYIIYIYITYMFMFGGSVRLLVRKLTVRLSALQNVRRKMRSRKIKCKYISL